MSIKTIAKELAALGETDLAEQVVQVVAKSDRGLDTLDAKELANMAAFEVNQLVNAIKDASARPDMSIEWFKNIIEAVQKLNEG